MECKKDFPIFQESNIVYLDNAATTQKPETVINSFRIYEKYNGNVHRCPHKWGRLMTDEYEKARQKAADFFHVKESGTVIFTRGATEGINLVASSYLPYIAEDRNEVVVAVAEHHSNFVPWQQWCRKTGKKLIVLPTGENGNVDLQMLEEAITERTALVAMAHITNVFGILQPVEEAAKLAHDKGALLLVDGAQAAGHISVDFEKLGCDFYAVSGHKMYGPTGIGLLLGKKDILNQMEPWQYGGEMIDQVSIATSSFQEAPYRFEAGTPDYVGAVGLGKALDYLSTFGMEEIRKSEEQIFRAMVQKIRNLERVKFPVDPEISHGILSFEIEGLHPFDGAILFDAQKIAVRSGMHCAQPLMKHYGLPEGTLRISVGMYTDMEDVEKFTEALERILERV